MTIRRHTRRRHWHRGLWLLPSSSHCRWQATSNGLTITVPSVIVLASAFDPRRASPDPDLDRRAAALGTIRRIRTSSRRQVRTCVIAARPDVRHSGKVGCSLVATVRPRRSRCPTLSLRLTAALL